MAFGKNKKDKNKDVDLYEGLTFKEMKMVGKKSIALNDIAWAGRLYSKFHPIFEDLTKAIVVMLSISAICLAAIWISIFMRTPALLLGVYPSGQVICFPRLVTVDGKPTTLHSSYHDMCSSLEAKVGSKWQVDSSATQSDDQAVGRIDEDVKYSTVQEIIDEKFPGEISQEQGE